MGVHGLLGFAKPAASRYVDLRYGQGGRIIADGHYLLHKFFYREGCALALVMGDDVKPLAREIVNHVTAFTNARWNVTIVFDGSSPPAKRRTATSRAKKRDAAREKCLAAAAMGDLDSASNHAKQAPSFSARVVARVSSIVMHETLAETTTAPFEADGQLKAMEDFYADGGERCLVYGTDSDLLVLGARSVLWEVSSPGGILGGQVIYTDNILRPSPSVFTGGSAGRFMRMLHGVGPEGELQKESPSLPSAGIVVERLLDFSCLAGNDYLKISGIGPATAIDIALAGDVVPDNEDTHSRDARMTDLAQKVVARFPASGSVQDVRQDISIARDMFEHQVVWMPETGKHAHLSGTATSEVLQVATGPLRPKKVAVRIAGQLICPVTLRPWDPPIEETCDGQSPCARPLHPSSDAGHLSDVPGYLRQATGADNAASLNHVASVFPREGEDLRTWNVQRLMLFLNIFRCLEFSGLSTTKKADLLELAESCIRIVKASKPGSAGHLFRMPANKTTPAERTRAVMPNLPPSDQWVSGGPDVLRPLMPVVELSVILEWLVFRRSHLDPPGRVISRGLQRAMDVGALEGLSIVPASEGSSSVWLRLRVVASMRNDVYLTHVLLAVHQLGGEEDGERATQDDGECSDESESDTGERLMATTVQNANCQCMAGAQGGCHHVCMLLQLVRLLQMSSRELMSHNPETPTGRACKWILNHCRGGRGASDKEWHFLPLWRMVDRLREVRDPKRQCLGLGQQKAASTRGVVAINRKSALNPHPDGGRWAESRKHFDEGVTISTKQADHVEEFIASLSELTLGTRGFVDSDMMATRVLPARVRSDSGEDSCQDSGESLRDDPDEETCDDSGEDSCGGSV